MADTETIRSACGLCASGCGVLVTVEEGRAVGIKGDPESPPNRGRLCRIGLASLEYLYSPDRLTQPLKRIGQRGGGKWETVSWEEAFSLTADALNKIKKPLGPEGVVMVHGSAKGPIDTHLIRLANAFRTPNVVCSDHVCHVPRMLAAELTFGYYPGGGYGNPPRCAMVWGVNIPATRSSKYREFVQAVKKGMKVISIDPLQTGIASKADLWLRIRPGTDLALGLGMIHVIIKERLYDREFVDKWTVGFDELKAHVQDYPPERVSDITWIPSDLIIEAARMYAGNRPARIEWGNALDQQLDSFQAARAVSILMAITGNLGVPGGEEETRGSGFRDADPDKESSQIGVLGRWSRELELRHMMKAEDRKRKVGPDLLPDFRYVLPQSVVQAILQDDPYPIRAMFIQASNPLSCWPNLQKTFEAFQGLDFLAVSDMFMTQTAAMADIVFPAASYLEYDGVQITPQGTIAQFQRKVAQIGECRSDHEIINGLAKQLGLGEFFWDSIDAFWDTILAPAGLTFEELRKRDRFVGQTGEKEYRQYEKSGFKTPSGKVEIYSDHLGRWGFDPLPTYGEAPGNPDQAGEYPLLCTTWKLGVYRHSGGRQIPSLRRVHPDPRVIIHPEAAAERGIAQGDWVTIETPSGMIAQKANVSALVDPRVVVADHAWWFPERDGEDLFGFQDANYNVLTTDRPPHNKEMGSFSIRGIACNVFRKR